MRSSIMAIAVASAALVAAPATATVVFTDNFDGENGGDTALNYDDFANFAVTGNVDLVATPNGFGIDCSGSCVDLDGTTGPGEIDSLQSFSFNAGDMVRLSFDLSGNQRSNSFDQFAAGFTFDGATDLINVGFNYSGSDTILFPMLTNGSVFRSGLTRGSDPFSRRSVFFTAGEAGSFTFMIGSNSADNIGPILDNISLSIAPSIPEPATWAMLIFGFGMIGASVRRSRKLAVKPAYA